MRTALVQLNGSDNPEDNLTTLHLRIAEAAEGGADFVLTPEVSNCISTSRSHQQSVLHYESDDPSLTGLQALAQEFKIWLLVGSLALKTDDADGRFANRSFMIGPTGEIAARYDKIHMFDVALSESEHFKESDGYRPGDQATLASTSFADVGLTICYDLRFPHLFRSLATAGAQIITVPSAFARTTGTAHWHVLLRARAIETGCFILAPAQTGTHKGRETYGHSLIVAPWGKVILDMGIEPGVGFADLDLEAVNNARQRVPSLSHDRPYAAPIMRNHERDQ